jgi:hypothetical protein
MRRYAMVVALGVALVVVASALASIPPRQPGPGEMWLPVAMLGEAICAGAEAIDAELRGDRNDPRLAWMVDIPTGRRTELAWPRG